MGYKGLELDGKVAVVIGGSSGIGRTLALGLAQGGADVVASARRSELVKTVADEIESFGRRSLRVTSDVDDRESLEKLLKASVDAFGKVDIMVNAAGITKRAPTLDFPEADWNRIIETNLTGTLRACQVFGRHMIERHYGRIINIASMGSFSGALRSGSLLGEQIGPGIADQIAGDRMGSRRYLRECNCARIFPHAAQRKAPGRHRPRTGSDDAYSDEALRRTRRIDRCRDFPRV